MAPGFAILEVLISIGLATLCVRTLLNQRHGGKSWALLASILLGALFAGYWFSFHFEYQPKPGMIVHSFPVPGAFEVLETYDSGEQQWTHFVVPAPLIVAVCNTVALGLSCTSIIGGVVAAHGSVRPPHQALPSVPVA